jgi:hypothetical protein
MVLKATQAILQFRPGCLHGSRVRAAHSLVFALPRCHCLESARRARSEDAAALIMPVPVSAR